MQTDSRLRNHFVNMVAIEPFQILFSTYFGEPIPDPPGELTILISISHLDASETRSRQMQFRHGQCG